MIGVVVRGLRDVAVEQVPDADLEATTDALLRVTSTAICGSDLHIYEGRMDDADGMLIGHEPVGVVEDVLAPGTREGGRPQVMPRGGSSRFVEPRRETRAPLPDVGYISGV